MCDISIRLLKDIEEDYKLLEKWYQEEEIHLNFEQRKLNYKEIKEKYYQDDLNFSIFVLRFKYFFSIIKLYKKVCLIFI